jgi:transposase
MRDVVQCDGYAAYMTIVAKAPDGRITLAFCWSHLRRRFFDHANDQALIAREALERIAALYAIEKTRRASSHASGEEQTARHGIQTLARASASARLRKARDRRQTSLWSDHWEWLVPFLDDGRIELATKIVERSIHPIVLNRKNALFAGHDKGAENWACVASLIETCKLNDVEPQAYIAGVLDRLVSLWPASHIDELMPWAWAKASPPDRIAAYAKRPKHQLTKAVQRKRRSRRILTPDMSGGTFSSTSISGNSSMGRFLTGWFWSASTGTRRIPIRRTGS